MKVIGLTGGIASGKSTASKMLRELGAPVVDADVLAREVVEPGTEGWREVIEAFGPGIVLPGGQLDRERLARLVFADEAARRRLNAIIHPRVRERMQASVEEARAAGEPAVVLDVPLLMEGGLDAECDQVWVVYVDEETQLFRLMHRDGLPPEEARRRIAAQLPLREKAARADVVIYNTGAVEETRRQVETHWRQVVPAP